MRYYFADEASNGNLAVPLNEVARRQAEELLAARLTGVRYDVQPQLPPDVLGVYVLLPPI